MSEKEISLFDDEIDLRPYIHLIRRQWPWIVLTTVVAAAVAAFLSFFVISPTYEATAVVAITPPRYLMQFSQEFEPLAQDRLLTSIYTALPQLARSDDLLQQVAEALAATSGQPAPDLESLRQKFSVQATKEVGLISLQVRDKDPHLAATQVNIWADLYVKMLGRLYRDEGEEYPFFVEQLSLAEGSRDAARQALAEFKARDPSALLNSELQARIAAMDGLLATQNSAIELQAQIADWRAQLTTQPGNRPLSPADEITSLLLQLKAHDLLEKSGQPTFQISVDQTTQGRTVADQIAFLDGLQSLLQDRLTEIEAQVAALQPQILELQQKLQAATNENDRLTQQVKITTSLYESLARKTEEARIASESQTGVGRLASRAAVPTRPVSPRKLLNTALGAGLGLGVGLALALLLELTGGQRTKAGDGRSDDGS